jgi:hypothetical protein
MVRAIERDLNPTDGILVRGDKTPSSFSERSIGCLGTSHAALEGAFRYLYQGGHQTAQP